MTKPGDWQLTQTKSSEEASVSCLAVRIISGATDWNGVQISYEEGKEWPHLDPQVYFDYILFLFSVEEIQFIRWIEEERGKESVSKNKVKVITAWQNLKNQKLRQNSRYLRLTVRNNFILNTCAFLMTLLAWWLCSPPSAGSADLFNSIKPVGKVNLSLNLKGLCSKVSLTLANNHPDIPVALAALEAAEWHQEKRLSEKVYLRQQHVLSVLRRDNILKTAQT